MNKIKRGKASERTFPNIARIMLELIKMPNTKILKRSNKTQCHHPAIHRGDKILKGSKLKKGTGGSNRQATRQRRDTAQEGEAAEVLDGKTDSRPRRVIDIRASIMEEEKGDPGLAPIATNRGTAEAAFDSKISAARELTLPIWQTALTSDLTRASGGINDKDNPRTKLSVCKPSLKSTRQPSWISTNTHIRSRTTIFKFKERTSKEPTADLTWIDMRTL